MLIRIEDYLDEIEGRFLLSPVVSSVQVREREERLQEGFIRIKAGLTDGSLLEAFEFIVTTPAAIQTLTYRIHWQGENGQIKRRWDNAPHHRDISTFPHHVHSGPAESVEPSEPMTILKALAFVERELQQDERSS